MVYGKKGSYMDHRQTHIQGDVTINASLPPTNPANVAYFIYIHIYTYTYIRLDKPPKRLVALPAMVPDQLAAEVRLFDNAGEGFADVWGYFVLEP